MELVNAHNSLQGLAWLGRSTLPRSKAALGHVTLLGVWCLPGTLHTPRSETRRCTAPLQAAMQFAISSHLQASSGALSLLCMLSAAAFLRWLPPRAPTRLPAAHVRAALHRLAQSTQP